MTVKKKPKKKQYDYKWFVGILVALFGILLTIHFSNDKPVAKIIILIPYPYVPCEVTFDGSSSNDQDGNISEYKWTLENKTLSGKKRFKHIFKTPGIYHVHLTVKDNSLLASKTDKATVEIKVEQSPPFKARINATPVKGLCPLKVFFDGSASTASWGKILRYQWTLDGDVISKEPQFNYTFPHAGTHRVTLMIQDERNKNSQKTVIIEVQEKKKIRQKMYHVRLYLPSDMVDGNIFIDGKKCKHILDVKISFVDILLAKKSRNYRIEVQKGTKICSKEILITKDGQEVILCPQ